MQKRLLINLLLLLVALVLGSIVIFEPGKDEQPEAVRLTELDDTAIDRFTLKNDSGEIAFEKRDGHWWLASPFSAPANDIRVGQLLAISHTASATHYPLNTEDLSKFELDKPKASMTLGQVKIVFGGVDPIDLRRYVWVDKTLHLVDDDFSHHISAPATDYVERKLLPEGSRPNALLLPGLKLSQDKDGHWLADPVTPSASAASDLAAAWQTARAIDVTQIKQPVQGDVIHIDFLDHAPIEFVILKRDPDLILARADWGLQYQITAETSLQLLTLAVKPTAVPSAPTVPNDNAEEEDSEPASSDDQLNIDEHDADPDEAGSAK
jgi:hypothetical protein